MLFSILGCVALACVPLSMVCVSWLDVLFDDKRVSVCVLMIWLSAVLIVFKDIGLLDSQFMHFGPSEGTKIMGIKMDSWYKWALVAVFTFVNTTVNDFMSDAISPWLLNTLTDHKTRYIPYPKLVCLTISQFWSVYCNIMGIFGLFLAMSQIDFVLIRMCADLMVNCFTCMKFMRNKTHCPEKYRQHFTIIETDETDIEKGCGGELKPLNSEVIDLQKR